MARLIDAEFGPCDPVLFLALWWGGGRTCTLTDIIGLYDCVNRDIPTAEVLDGGLNRLLAAGLVVQRRDGFCIPAKVVRQYDAFRRRRRRDRFDTAGAFVRSAGPPEAVPRRVTVRAADHERAYADYRRRFKEALEKVSR